MAEQLEAYDPKLRPVLAALKPQLWPIALYILTGQAVPQDSAPLSREGTGRVMRLIRQSNLYKDKAVQKRFEGINQAEIMLNDVEAGASAEDEKVALKYKSLLELISKIGLGFQSPWAECSAGANLELAVKRHGQFYPGRRRKGGTEILEVKAMCYRCLVRDACLDYALKNKETFGIWGGLSERQRRKIRRLQANAPEEVEAAIFQYHSLNLKAVSLFLKGAEADDSSDDVDPELVQRVLGTAADDDELEELDDEA